MDYSAQIEVIIGKPLTFRHYPYPYMLYRTLDMGFRIYSIQGTYAEHNKRSVKPTRLALRLSLSYIYFYPHFPCASLFSLHQGVWAYSNAECMGTAMACFVPV